MNTTTIYKNGQCLNWPITNASNAKIAISEGKRIASELSKKSRYSSQKSWLVASGLEWVILTRTPYRSCGIRRSGRELLHLDTWKGHRMVKASRRKYQRNFCVGLRLEVPNKFLGGVDLTKVYKKSDNICLVDFCRGGKVIANKSGEFVLAKSERKWWKRWRNTKRCFA